MASNDTNPLIALHEHGQSFWLDNIRREWLRQGTLARMVETRGLRGLTSNPAIFHKAITGSSAYDAQIAKLVEGGATAVEIYEALAIQDIQDAADVLRPVFDGASGHDGFVSLEVSPLLAHDTEGTIAEGRRLFAAVARPNVMIKVPGTAAGIPAIEALIGEGIPVNVTLLFSPAQYEAAALAYIRGLENRRRNGDRVDDVASVASVFLSRIDSLVDGLLGQRLVPDHRSGTGDDAVGSLFGRAAVAAAKVTYQRFRELFSGERWAALEAAGARVQRPLWASTSTKSPLYPDTKYVEPLIGPHTVNTMPDETADAFEARGTVGADTIGQGLGEAHAALEALSRHGIDLDQVCQQLQDEGVGKFTGPFAQLIEALDTARAGLLADRQVALEVHPGKAASAYKGLLAALEERRAMPRLWAGDATLFGQDAEATRAIANRLGWRSLPRAFALHVDELETFAAQVRNDGVREVIVLGMGGSSLCTEVVTSLFGRQADHPQVRIVDTTHPDAIRALDASLKLSSTLFVVASKSGGTLETMALYRYFRARVEATLGAEAAGRHFVAVTDPQSSLASLAHEQGFRRVFLNPADVGGRYSALSWFGLVPMALAGLDVGEILARASETVERCNPWLSASRNPAAQLGAFMAASARSGRMAMSVVTPPKLRSLGDWLEQLVAESTGKQGRGVLPVVGEPLEHVGAQGRSFVFIRTRDAAEGEAQQHWIERFREAGAPVAVLTLSSALDVGQAFMLWELATAIAGAALVVNPFDEPDVKVAKTAAKRALEQLDRTGAFSEPETLVTQEGIGRLQADALSARQLGAPRTVGEALRRALSEAQAAGRSYVALMAYLPGSAETQRGLEALREAILRHFPGLVVTTGIGPRLLHSIGQLYKGGPDSGLFVQLVDRVQQSEPLGVPGQPHDFNTLVSAQALGDITALAERARPSLRLVLERGTDSLEALTRDLAAAPLAEAR